MTSIVPAFREALYTLGNDLHRGRIREARVLRVHPDNTADLAVFGYPDESANEAGDRNTSGIFVKLRVAQDAKGGPATWRSDPDSPVETLGRVVEAQEQQVQILIDELAKLRARLDILETPAPAPAPPTA